MLIKLHFFGLVMFKLGDEKMAVIVTVGTFQLPGHLSDHSKEGFYYYEHYIRELEVVDLDLLVCPPDAIRYFKDNEDYLLYHQKLAIRNSWIVAPGFFLRDQYNTAILISAQGEIIHEQQQTHLSQEELGQGLKRGNILEVVDTPIGKIGLMIGTDSFYPVVGRILGLQKVDIVVGYYKQPVPNNPWLQFSGVWQQVQHNQFFAVESAVNGMIDGIEFAGKTIIHHPLCRAYDDECIKKLESGIGGSIYGFFDGDKRKQGIQEFPIYKHFNCALYEKMWEQQ